MDKKDLKEQGFNPEDINNLLEVKARNKADKMHSQIVSKWAVGTSMLVPGYEYKHAVSGDLSDEEALLEFDKHVDPYSQAERPSEEIVNNRARKMLLERYDLTFAPIYPHPLITPDWKEAMLKNMYVRFLPLLSGKNKGLYLFQAVISGEDKKDIQEGFAIASRPETLEVLISQLAPAPSSAK